MLHQLFVRVQDSGPETITTHRATCNERKQASKAFRKSMWISLILPKLQLGLWRALKTHGTVPTVYSSGAMNQERQRTFAVELDWLTTSRKPLKTGSAKHWALP